MPVYKFRSVEEMSSPRWRKPGDPALYLTMARLWEVGRRTSRRNYPAGVHKHPSVEAMSQAQDDWARTRPGMTKISGS